MTPTGLDPAMLATIASIIAAFGAAMLSFRIHRELSMQEKGERVWIPAADWLLVAATLMCLLLVILPLVFGAGLRLPAAASGAAVIMVAGYVPAILAHYRIGIRREFGFFGQLCEGPRDIAEPAEMALVAISSIGAAFVFAFRLLA